MDAFINLSINDRNDEPNDFIDINNIASLSINESNNNNNNNNNMMYGSNNSIRFRDPKPMIHDMNSDSNIVSDDTDIDMQSDSDIIIQSNKFDILPFERIPNEQENAIIDIPVLEEEHIDEELNSDIENNDKEETVIQDEPSMLHNILSPTQLGINAARRNSVTNVSDIPEISNNSNNYKQSWKDRPIHVSINNNNNFYYQDPRTSDQQYTIGYDNYTSDHEQLPPPWSSKSSPVSRMSYNFYSYLQLTLNSLTGTIIIWFLISAIKKDIYSMWYSDQRQLLLESQACQEDWLINDCEHNKNLPALSDRCNEWQRCMTRDNNKLFGTRSIRIVTLLGQLINGFIQPIGWKPVTVILISIITWLFLTNFLMGFLRAKYYYNERDTAKNETNLIQETGNNTEQKSNTNKAIQDVVDSSIDSNQQLQLTLASNKQQSEEQQIS